MLSRILFRLHLREVGADAQPPRGAFGHRFVWRPAWQYHSSDRPTGWWRAL